MDGQYGIHQRSGKTEPVAGLTLEVPLVEECSETVVAQIAVEVHLREFIEGSLAVAYVSAIVEEFSVRVIVSRLTADERKSIAVISPRIMESHAMVP